MEAMEGGVGRCEVQGGEGLLLASPSSDPFLDVPFTALEAEF